VSKRGAVHHTEIDGNDAARVARRAARGAYRHALIMSAHDRNEPGLATVTKTAGGRVEREWRLRCATLQRVRDALWL
jgi:hypothetical protein